MLNEEKLSYEYWKEEIYTVIYILNKGQIKVNKDKTLMNYGMEDQRQSNISKYLAVCVTLKGMRMILASLTLGLMKEYF